MQYILSKQFEKSFSKLSKKVKDKTINRLEIFIVDAMDSSLRNHSLSGKWSGYRSIKITSDIRAIYTIIDSGIVRFVDIGSHSELYS